MQNDFQLPGTPLPFDGQSIKGSDQLGTLLLNPDGSTAGIHPYRRNWLALEAFSNLHALTLTRLPTQVLLQRVPMVSRHVVITGRQTLFR